MAFNLQSFTGFKVDIVSSTVPQKTPTVLYGYPLQFLPSHLSLVLQIYHKFVIYQINCRKIKKKRLLESSHFVREMRLELTQVLPH